MIQFLESQLAKTKIINVSDEQSVMIRKTAKHHLGQQSKKIENGAKYQLLTERGFSRFHQSIVT